MINPLLPIIIAIEIAVLALVTHVNKEMLRHYRCTKGQKTESKAMNIFTSIVRVIQLVIIVSIAICASKVITLLLFKQ